MIRELKTLVAVAREGTFAAAGNKIGLTQAAVSAQIQRLETELGLELFDRTGRSATLNATGRQTLSQAQELLKLYHKLGSPEPESQGTQLITLGAIASFQRRSLPDALSSFHQENSGIRTRVLPGLSMELLDLVDSGTLDLAVIIKPAFDFPSDLQWTLLAREPYRLLVPDTLPEAEWTELISSHPFVRYDRASFGGRQVERFLRRLHIQVKELCELDELEAIAKLVANGTGVALLPETVGITSWPQGARAIDLREATFYREIGMVHTSKSDDHPVMRLARLIASFARDATT